jgi:hypothetical protein
LTGIDGAAILPLHDRPPSMDRALPDALATLEAEYFVEWQVADIAPFVRYASAGEPNSL